MRPFEAEGVARREPPGIEFRVAEKQVRDAGHHEPALAVDLPAVETALANPLGRLTG